MVAKLYLDGCSLTYGQGLPREQSLGHLFEHEGHYIVKDMSRNGKSNLAICMDIYQNWKEFDIFVVAFTFSSRFGIKYLDQNIDFFAGSHGLGFDLNPMDLDLATLNVYKYFYTIFQHPYCDRLSDMLIDTIISFLNNNGKKVVPVSWEPRQTQNILHYPYISPADRLEDGHLNREGTKKLYQQIGVLIDRQQRG